MRDATLSSALTPGPWRVGGDGTGRIIETNNGAIAIAMLNLAAPEATAAANARLIATGPELYEALYSLANEASASMGAFEFAMREAIGNTNYACLELRVAMARAALAKVL